MRELYTGQFYGQTNETLCLKNVTLTDTEYTEQKVDWHYHRNAYFTFILQGKLLEGNRKETLYLTDGSLLFHNWQEPHFNVKPSGYTRGFHIEINHKWLEDYSVSQNRIEGSLHLKDPKLKLLLYNIFKEFKMNDDTTPLAIHTLLLETLTTMQLEQHFLTRDKPLWVRKIDEILHEQYSLPLSLKYLSKTLGIHPVHLSRDFSKYFNCSLGEYIRKLKVGKSLSLFTDSRFSLTEIAYTCGFSDQSHFIRCFRELTGLNPMAFRKLLL